MKLLRLFIVPVHLMALVHSNTGSSMNIKDEEEEEEGGDGPDVLVEAQEDDDYEVDDGGWVLSYSESATGRLLMGSKRSAHLGATCDKLPKVCRQKGSPGRNCCNAKCVNLSSDWQNCGKCGRECKYGFICCKRKCVNPTASRQHCGRCNKRCKSGGSCAVGICIMPFYSPF